MYALVRRGNPLGLGRGHGRSALPAISAVPSAAIVSSSTQVLLLVPPFGRWPIVLWGWLSFVDTAGSSVQSEADGPW